MPKKQQISLKELKKQVSLIINDQDLDYFDLNISINEQDSSVLDQISDEGAEYLMQNLGPKPGQVAGDVLQKTKKLQKKAIDWQADHLYSGYGPASQGVIDTTDTIKKFLGQVEGVWNGVIRQFNSTKRAMDRKLIFDGKTTTQAIFRVGGKNQTGLKFVRQHFLMFPDFARGGCKIDLRFTTSNFSGAAPSFTDPGVYCLSNNIKAVLNHWNSKNPKTKSTYRDHFISLCESGSTNEQGLPVSAPDKEGKVRDLIESYVEHFLSLFDDYVKITPLAKTPEQARMLANLSVQSMGCTLQKANAIDKIKKIYLQNKDFFEIRTMSQAAKKSGKVKNLSTGAYRPAEPCILDCLVLCLAPVSAVVSNLGVDVKELSKKTLKKGVVEFLEQDYRTEMLPKVIKKNKKFKKSWFAFTHSMYYNPYNEDPKNKGYQHWAEKTEAFSDGSYKNKTGYDILANIAVSTLEVSVAAAVVQGLSSKTLALIGKEGAAAVMASPKAFIIISLALAGALAVAYAWDPFKTYTKMDELKEAIKKMQNDFNKLKDLYNSNDLDDEGNILIDENTLNTIKESIETQGTIIQKIILQISSTSAQWAIEDKKIDLKQKQNLTTELDQIVRWFHSNTQTSAMDWWPSEVNQKYAQMYTESLENSSKALGALIVELEGGKKATGKQIKLILPNFSNIGGNLPVSAIGGIEAQSKSGSMFDLGGDEPSDSKVRIKSSGGSLKEILGPNPNKDFPIDSAKEEIKTLHTRLQKFFPETFYKAGKQGFRTEIDNLKRSGYKLIKGKIEKSLKEMFKRSNKITVDSVAFYAHFDNFAKEAFTGSWPTVRKIREAGKNGLTVPSVYEDQFRTSGMGMISNNFSTREALTIVIGPSGGLYNTSIFVGDRSTTWANIIKASKLKLFYDEQDPKKFVVNPVKSSKNQTFSPPKLHFVERIGELVKEINLISDYTTLLSGEVKKTSGVRATGSQGVENDKKENNYNNLIEIARIYKDFLQMVGLGIARAVGFDPSNPNNWVWNKEIEKFKQSADSLNNLNIQDSNSSSHAAIVEDLRTSGVEILKIYDNYSKIIEILKDNQAQIKFGRIFDFFEKTDSSKN